MKLISIVVPVYNMEKYLERCVSSILEQTYNNFELILIDDGSTDSSGLICEKYQNQDSRIKAIHKLNGGLSDARNTGIRVAKGEYICFIDSDDFVSPYYIEKLLNACENYSCDVAICDRLRGYDSQFPKDENNIKSEEIEVMTSKEMILKYYAKSYSACTSLFKKQLFDNIEFPVGKLHEDQDAIYRVIYNASNVSIVHENLYYVFLSADSITRSKYSIKRMDEIWAVERRILFFEDKNEVELQIETIKKFCEILMFHYCEVSKSDSIDNSFLDIILNKYKNVYKIAINSYFEEKNVLKATELLFYRYVPHAYKLRRQIAKFI